MNGGYGTQPPPPNSRSHDHRTFHWSLATRTVSNRARRRSTPRRQSRRLIAVAPSSPVFGCPAQPPGCFSEGDPIRRWTGLRAGLGLVGVGRSDLSVEPILRLFGHPSALMGMSRFARSIRRRCHPASRRSVTPTQTSIPTTRTDSTSIAPTGINSPFRLVERWPLRTNPCSPPRSQLRPQERAGCMRASWTGSVAWPRSARPGSGCGPAPACLPDRPLHRHHHPPRLQSRGAVGRLLRNPADAARLPRARDAKAPPMKNVDDQRA
jgi:hypothetical protein